MKLLLFICLFDALVGKVLSHKNDMMHDQQVLPVGSDGFVRMRYYASSVCRGSVSLERGYYADYCYRAGDGDYFKFFFTTGLSVCAVKSATAVIVIHPTHATQYHTVEDCSDLVTRHYADDECSQHSYDAPNHDYFGCRDATDSRAVVPALSSYRGSCTLGNVAHLLGSGYEERYAYTADLQLICVNTHSTRTAITRTTDAPMQSNTGCIRLMFVWK